MLYCLRNYKKYYSFYVVKAYYFTKSLKIFKDYISEMFLNKITFQKYNNKLSLMIKNMLNSLSGILATHSTYNRIDWASAIVSESRIFIQEIFDKVDVYYNDVDMFVIKRADLYKISSFIDTSRNESTIGAFRILDFLNMAIFLGPKCYLAQSDSLVSSTISLQESIKSLSYLMKVNSLNNSLVPMYTLKANFYKLSSFNNRIKVFVDNIWTTTKPLKL